MLTQRGAQRERMGDAIRRSASIQLAFFWCDSVARTMVPKPTQRGAFAASMRRRSCEMNGGGIAKHARRA
jgi:hypothetical protein